MNLVWLELLQRDFETAMSPVFVKIGIHFDCKINVPATNLKFHNLEINIL